MLAVYTQKHRFIESIYLVSKMYVIPTGDCTLDVNSELSSRWIFLGFWYVTVQYITELWWKNQLYNIFSCFCLYLG